MEMGRGAPAAAKYPVGRARTQPHYWSFPAGKGRDRPASPCEWSRRRRPVPASWTAGRKSRTGPHARRGPDWRVRIPVCGRPAPGNARQCAKGRGCTECAPIRRATRTQAASQGPVTSIGEIGRLEGAGGVGAALSSRWLLRAFANRSRSPAVSQGRNARQGSPPGNRSTRVTSDPTA
jgi:hypothetical protein